MDEKSRMRQFWLRVVLAAGMLLGTMPLLTIPFVILSAKGPSFDLLALVFNAVTVLPACVMAFWHRRVACFWLSLNGALAAVALATYTQRVPVLDSWHTAGIAASLILALCLDFMEIMRWPTALET